MVATEIVGKKPNVSSNYDTISNFSFKKKVKSLVIRIILRIHETYSKEFFKLLKYLYGSDWL